MEPSVALLILSLHTPALAQPPVWQPIHHGVTDARLTVVAVDPTHPGLLYAGARHAVYATHDGGLQWRRCLQLPAQAELTDLVIDPFDNRHVLAATTNGLYGSSDGGRDWTMRFRQPGAARCQTILFHPQRRQEVFVGTAGGVFASADGGRHWRVFGAALGGRSVRDLDVDPQQPQRLYALSDQGLFVNEGTSEAWTRIFVVSDDSPEEAPSAEIDDAIEESEQPQDASRQPTALAIDPHDPKRLYVATTGGLFVSPNGGSGWQRATQLGLGTAQIHHLILHAHSPTVAYAATPQGVARYRPSDGRWETLYAGLPTPSVHWLAATQSQVFAATDQGLYMLDLTEEQIAQGHWPSAREILSDFVHEPTITQVREVAIRYAEVEPEKIQRWRRQAYLKAFFPSVKFAYSRDQDTYLNAIGSTTNPAFDRIIHASDPSRNFDVSMNWELGDLIWNNDQTSIDTRSRLMVQLRDDILNEVTRNFFERRRLQVELLTDPPKEPSAQLDRELRVQELSALLDGLTGGWFSKQIEQNQPR